MKVKCTDCKQTIERPCSCCGIDWHTYYHPNCPSFNTQFGSCERYWEAEENRRLELIEEIKQTDPSRIKELERELAHWKKYRDNEMANDTTTPADIKNYIVDYIAKLEKRIVNEKPETQGEIEENKKKLLAELEKYKQEVYYSKHKPINANCPHWRKYALNENNQPPSENSSEKSFSANHPSAVPSKSGSNTGLIIVIVAFAAFSAIGLGYLVWKKVVKK